jgi:hypothetical protein
MPTIAAYLLAVPRWVAWSTILCVLLVVFIAGRHSRPEKVRVETHTVAVQTETEEVERRIWDANTAAIRRAATVIHERTVAPDGTVKERTETRTRERTQTAREVHTQERQQREAVSVIREHKQVERTSKRSDYRLGALVGVDLSSKLTPRVGLHGEARVLGPLYLGGWALTAPRQPYLWTVGVSVSGEF